VTAAVILNPTKPIEGLADSKKLSEKKRVSLFERIRSEALCWSIGQATPQEIDQLNVLQATMLAMTRAAEGLALKPNWIWVDGNRCPSWSYPSQAVIKGDSLIPEISAASILAKVTRDKQMLELDKHYPEYGFAQHKGYPTKLHLENLNKLGLLPGYRRSFKPVLACLKSGGHE
jgi:ribonuclease HII